MTTSQQEGRSWDPTPNAWWLRHGRLAGLALIAGGGVLVLGACIGVLRADYLLNELSYIATGGVMGVFCAVVGAACVAATELGRSRRRLELLERRSTAAPAESPAVNGDAVIDVADRAEPTLMVRR
jgi:hypothetical protein